MSQSEQPVQPPKPARVEPVMSLRAKDGMVIETILKPEEGESRLVTFRDGQSAEHRMVSLEGHRYVPYSPSNNLLTHRVIVLPSAVDDYKSEPQLLADVQAFIHRYVDLSPGFEEIAAHYVLMTWGYDVFNALPYLRVRGRYGSGKSRFLLTVGSLCFKPIFASGASTVSPLFRLIDQIGGTLVVDEADFWASDERAEITKILNNGNARGFPVLRSELTPAKEFNPRAFDIFGPKLVATRHRFDDEALESRCLTEVLGERPLRQDIPISLPRTFEDEALALRNQLLNYRFRRFGRDDGALIEAASGLEPRRAQILVPLLSVAVTQEARTRISAFAESIGGITEDSRTDAERRVLASVKAVLEDASVPLTLGSIAHRFDTDWSDRYGIEVSPRWIGGVLRRLGVRPVKSNGASVIQTADYPYLRDLFATHLSSDIRDNSDVDGTTALNATA